MNYLIHATPVHLSLCLQSLILLFTIATITTITVFTLLLSLLFYYYHHYRTVATDKPLRASLFPGAAELTTHLVRLINILWLPLCRINKFGFYFPRGLLRSPILVGYHRPSAYIFPSTGKPKHPINFPRNILQATTIVDARSGGSKSSSRHPAIEGNNR
jgi:hypothetical protein